MPIGIVKNSGAQPPVSPELTGSKEPDGQLKKENVADGRKYVYMVLVKTKDTQGEIKTEIKTTDMKFGASSAKSIAKFISSEEGKKHLAGKTPEQLQRMENYLTLNAYKSQHVINNVLGQANYKSKPRVVLEKIMHFVINGPFNSSKHYKTALAQVREANPNNVMKSAQEIENPAFTPTDIKPEEKQPVGEPPAEEQPEGEQPEAKRLDEKQAFLEEQKAEEKAKLEGVNKKWQEEAPIEKESPSRVGFKKTVTLGLSENPLELKTYSTNFSTEVFPVGGVRRRKYTDKDFRKEVTDGLTGIENGSFVKRSMKELQEKEGPTLLKEFMIGMKAQWSEVGVGEGNAKFIHGLLEDICDTKLRNPDQKLSCEDFKQELLMKIKGKATETLKLTRQDFLELAFTENSEGNLEPTEMKNLPPNLQESPVSKLVSEYTKDIHEGSWKKGDDSVRSLKLTHITDVDGEIKKVSDYLDSDEFKDVFNKLRNSKKEAEDV